MAKISVLGAGSWGTALSILLYNNGHEVILWSALGEEITTLREKREHVSKLPGVKIPEPIDITIDLERSLRDAVLLLACKSIAAVGSADKATAAGQLLSQIGNGICHDL